MKVQIDKFFSDHYEELLLITRVQIMRTQRNIDAESLIAESYLYLSNKKELLEHEIRPLAVGFICLELSRSNSRTNYKTIFKGEEFTDKHDRQVDQNDSLLLTIDIDSFYKTLDRFEKNIWTAFYTKGKTKKRELAEHFKIDETSAWIIINDLKNKYKKYVNTERTI